MFPVTVVNKYKHKGDGEYIGRGSPLGNPFPIGTDSREVVIQKYKAHLLTEIEKGNPVVARELLRLRAIAEEKSLNLICFCAPQACHGDFIKAIICEEI